MSFHRITYNEKHRFATVHNFGCTLRCPTCSYKLRSGPNGRPGQITPRPNRFLSMDEVRRALRSVRIEKVNFMGGEPTVATELPEALAFCKQELGVRTFLGHTIGLRLPLPHLDGANVGLKAWDDEVHRRYTGRERQPFFDNFAAAYRAGLEMRANIVFIPGFVDLDQVEAVAAWVAALDRTIPFHVMGYIPVPGQPFPRPTAAQMEQAVTVCRQHLNKVNASHLTVEEALNLVPRDDRFAVRQIA